MTIKAVKTKVNIGHIELDGYMLPDGSFGMSQSQISELVGIEPRQFANRISNSKRGKTLAAKGLVAHRKVKVDDSIKATNNTIIDLDWVVSVLNVCGRNGFEAAYDLIDDLAGYGLRKIFSDAFKVKFDSEDAQAWLKERQEGKFYRRTFTDAVKHLKDKGESINYAYVTMVVYGKCKLTADYYAYKQEVGDSKFRDTLTDIDLRKIAKMEELTADYIMVDGMSLEDAMQKAGRYIR